MLTWDEYLPQLLANRGTERWKYADWSWLTDRGFASLSPAATYHPERVNRLATDTILLVSVNGYFVPELSDLHKLTAAQYDGSHLHIPAHCHIEQPIHCLALTNAECEFMAHPQHKITIGADSQLILIEEHIALTPHAHLLNLKNNIIVSQQAKLQYYKIQHDNSQAIHLAETVITQQQDSQVTMAHFSVGSRFARDEIIVNLDGTGAECTARGLYRLRQDNQYIDYHLDINHHAPRTHSEMLYKGIVDKKARAVFNGRLYVKPDAQKIIAYQANHNLLLAPLAEVYSKPELEIYADDVKCKHGATVGQLDEEALFYLRSRGIAKKHAIEVLLQGFTHDILQYIAQPTLQAHLQEILL